ncbi:MAG: penicillin-binding transpeptidase domain-containing protein [Halofilum sp. (in: g-proteobacteria)]
MSKDEVLELYLNKIYLGQRAYGVGAAAQVYYGKPVAELTLAETAVIAGLPTAPSYSNPVANPERARQRRNYVLRRMHVNDMIDEETLRAALAAPITATSHSAPVELHAPYVAEMARLEAIEHFGDDVYTQGYRVYTTVDAGEQRAATRSLRDALIAYEARHGYGGRLAFIDARRIPVLKDLERMVETVGGVEESEAESESAAVQLDAGMLDLEQLDMVLGRHEGVGHLEPAVVVAVQDEDERAVVYRTGRRLDPITMESMAWAAPRLDGRRTGDQPEAPSDVLAAGDIVHVAPPAGDGAGVRLAQAPGVEGALVDLDPDAGGIRALAGGFDFDRSKFNRVTQARRQPGSNFKPFVYAAALNKGFTPATLVNDAPVVFDDPALEDTWRPENYSGRIFGPTRLREGLVYSRNLVSIRVLLEIGIPYTVDYLQRFGFPREQLPQDLTLALGSAALTPLQVATGYATFANGGFRVEPYLVTRIADGGGEVVYRANPARACPEPCEAREALEREAAEQDSEGARVQSAEETRIEDEGRPEELAEVGVPDEEQVPEPRFAERVLPEQDAYIVRSMLRDVARRGTARGTRVLDRDDIGGKTGTTDDQQDAWFSGFNDSVVATAWVGYDELESLGPYETGARAALPMWIDFMRVALADTPEAWPDLPSGMVTVRIDPETGEYAGPGDDNAVFEIFRSDNAPEPTSTARRRRDSGGDGEGSSEPLF